MCSWDHVLMGSLVYGGKIVLSLGGRVLRASESPVVRHSCVRHDPWTDMTELIGICDRFQDLRFEDLGYARGDTLCDGTFICLTGFIHKSDWMQFYTWRV